MTKNNVFGFTTNCPCRAPSKSSATQHQQERIFQMSVVLISTTPMLSLSQRLDIEIAGLGISKVYLGDNRHCVANAHISKIALQPFLK